MTRLLFVLTALLLSIILTAQVSSTSNIGYDIMENELHFQKPIQPVTSTQSIKQRLDSLITETFDGQNWTYLLKYVYSYDNDGLPTQYIRYTSPDEVWTPNARYDYFHDANGLQIERLYYSWNYAQWNLSSRYQYVYNSDGQITEISINDWDESAMQWLDNFKENYIYDASQKVIQSISRSWDSNTSTWENVYQADYTYNTNDEVSERIRYQWDELSGQWENYRKYIYNYDAVNNLTPYTIQPWDTGTNDWVNGAEFNYSYDNTYAYNDLIILFSEQAFRHLRTGYMTSTWIDNDWEVAQRGTYYYSEQELVSISDILAADFTIYPNPADDFVIFDLKDAVSATVELYNTQGKIVSVQALLTDRKLSIRHLPKGIYFYQLQDTNKRYSGKIVVK